MFLVFHDERFLFIYVRYLRIKKLLNLQMYFHMSSKQFTRKILARIHDIVSSLFPQPRPCLNIRKDVFP